MRRHLAPSRSSGWLAALLLGAGCASPGPGPAARPAPPPAPLERSAPAPHGALPAPVAPAPPAAAPLGWPLRGAVLSGFGAVRGRRHHEGIDIKAPRGTVVRAAAAGFVSESRWRRGYGNLVTIDHGGGLETVYAHLAEIWVRAGARVAPGEPIATVGATGNATTPHLHFEVRREGRARDPLAWLPSAGSETVSVPAAAP